jgi:cellulose biosynthesis protein BcsQ
MGSIISLVSQKGGVGKSAVARLLAVEFARAGWSVKIADLDTMQGTATRRNASSSRPNRAHGLNISGSARLRAQAAACC